MLFDEAEKADIRSEGLLGDQDNREAILAVSSFASTHSDDDLTTLGGYVERRYRTTSASSNWTRPTRW